MPNLSTTKIKCKCNWLGCKRRIVISEDDMLYVYSNPDKDSYASESFLLPRPIAKAIRDACKVMEDNDVEH